MINTTHDPRSLKYFEDYEKFMVAKYTSSEITNEDNPMDENEQKNDKKRRRPKNKIKFKYKHQFIAQMIEKGVVEELEHSQLCLSPENLCFNISRRTQERKPVSPHSEPKEEF